MDFIIKYWVQWVFGLIAGGLAYAFKRLNKKVKEQQKENQAVKDGLLALLHDRLYQSSAYFIERNSIDVVSMQNITKLYDAYHALGGNSTGTELYERIKNLPLESKNKG